MAESDPPIHRLLGWVSLDPAADNITADASIPATQDREPISAKKLPIWVWVIIGLVILVMLGHSVGLATFWSKKAAEQGLAVAQNNLVQKNGQGVSSKASADPVHETPVGSVTPKRVDGI